ncbi:hypothetical protein [Nitrosopumilus sp. S4]
MRYVSALLMVLLVVSLTPVYGQNIHFDETEEKIRAEILECEKNITSDDSMTEAVKTVKKRACTTDIRNKYAENPVTYAVQNEIKIKLQNLQKCQDWYSQYQYLDESKFKIQKNEQLADSCIVLYNDSLWKYDGKDREQILSDKLESIRVTIPVKAKSVDEFIKVAQADYDRVQKLEQKITQLEKELENKDLLIREQMNVILDLFSSMKNILFDGFKSVYSNI